MAIESRATEVAAVAYTMVILSSIAITLRVYCRAWLIKSFALDDWLAVAAQVHSFYMQSASYIANTDSDPLHRLLLLRDHRSQIWHWQAHS
jgi:hypothetical protein